MNIVNVNDVAELETDHTAVCLLSLVKDRNNESSPKPTECLIVNHTISVTLPYA